MDRADDAQAAAARVGRQDAEALVEAGAAALTLGAEQRAAHGLEALVPGPGIVADLDAGVWVRGEILTREVPG